MNENKIITDIEQLTPKWLTRIFKNKGYLSQGEIVEIINITPLRPDTESKTYSITLKFSKDTQIKVISSKIVIKVLSSENQASEAKFYSIVAKNMSGMPIPTCYDASYCEETESSHIILENFSGTHFQYSEYPPSKRYFKKAINSLAEIQAFWWDRENLKEFSEHCFNFYPMKSFKEEQNLKWIREQEKFLEFIENKVSDKRLDLLKKIFSLFPQIAHNRFKRGNITLIHNDAHTYNFYFPKNQKSKAILFDWEGWSIDVGCQDLVYMIGFWFYPDYRHLVEQDLLKYYHDLLLKYGVNNYSWDECWYDYRLYALLSIFRIVSWFAINLKISAWWRGLERALLTIDDLNSIELLE